MDWVYSTESLAGFVKGAKPELIGIKKKELVLKKIDKGLCNRIIIDNHYSHKTATDSHTLLYLGIFWQGKLKGAMQYGYAMNPASGDSIVKGAKTDDWLELNRLWIADDVELRNVESQIIGMSFKLIKKIMPRIKWIQSFADGRVGVGTIYQATNFLYCGSHKQTFVEFNGETHHIAKFSNSKKSFGRMFKGIEKELPKKEYEQHRYIYFLDDTERKNLLLPIKEYPKPESRNI